MPAISEDDIARPVAGGSVFASLFAYAACKIAGDDWDHVRQKWLADPAASPWPGFHTVGQLRAAVGRVELYCDGSTLITKARSRAAGAFLRSSEDVWVSIDDDLFADGAVLRRLIDAAHLTRAVVFAPYVLRSGKSLSFEFTKLEPEQVKEIARNLYVYPVERGIGFGLVALHRDALTKVAARVAWVTKQHEGPDFPGLFLEDVRGGEWLGEDVSFALKCHHAQIPVYALLDAPTQHGPHWCRLARDLQLFVRSP